MDGLMAILEAADDEDSKAMVAAYKCAECTTDDCNGATAATELSAGATKLRAGGVMTAILVSAVTLLSVRN